MLLELTGARTLFPASCLLAHLIGAALSDISRVEQAAYGSVAHAVRGCDEGPPGLRVVFAYKRVLAPSCAIAPPPSGLRSGAAREWRADYAPSLRRVLVSGPRPSRVFCLQRRVPISVQHQPVFTTRDSTGAVWPSSRCRRSRAPSRDTNVATRARRASRWRTYGCIDRSMPSRRM